VFVECNKHLVPFLLKILPSQNDFLRIRFEDVNTEEEPMPYVGNDFIPIKNVTKT
jgi:hypothetical protein